MVNSSILLNEGKKIILNRAYKAVPDYLAPSEFKVGISNDTPVVGDTDLDIAIPISNGTVIDNGSNLLAGQTPLYDGVADGGANTTNNTTTYKEGAGQADVTAQNLITDGFNTGVQKSWVLTPLTANFSPTEPFGFWFYILATEYVKFAAAGTALQLRIRNSGQVVGIYYYYNRTKAQLAVGWNWITSGTTEVGDLDKNGVPAGNLDEFVIQITTANATDEFIAGDVVYDLMRRWATTDLTKTFVAGYPTLDETNFEAETRCLLSVVEGNGFDVNGFGLFNTDASPLQHSEDTHTAESKSTTDEFVYICRDRLV